MGAGDDPGRSLVKFVIEARNLAALDDPVVLGIMP